ncbi:molybdopterin cofactor-binding domain-containing protein [Rhizobium yanglingense]
MRVGSRAVVHEGAGETSRYEQFTEALTTVTDYLYSCPNVSTQLPPGATRHEHTPNHMRGPGEASGIFALESAMDELSYKLGIDPIELKRRNEPQNDEAENKPFSSRSLMQCYELGADRFGWARTDPRTALHARRDVFRSAWAAATATYPAFPCTCERQSSAAGRRNVAEVEAAASDMGPGTYTSMTQVAAEFLGLPLEQVRFRLGRSDYPPDTLAWRFMDDGVGRVGNPGCLS